MFFEFSTRESSVVNMILTALHILFIAFVIVVGFWRGSWKNFTEPANPENPSGFFPHGAAGVFKGAAAVYLSYIGYDAVSTMAEEVKDPVKDIPVGVSGSVIIVTVLYCLMAASMSKLLPYDMVILLFILYLFMCYLLWQGGMRSVTCKGGEMILLLLIFGSRRSMPKHRFRRRSVENRTVGDGCLG